MKHWIIILLITLLGGCREPVPKNLADRYRYGIDQEYPQINEDHVWLRLQIVGVDSLRLYDFFRFSSNGQVFHGFGIPIDSLEGRYNDFSKGQFGRYQASDETIHMELWINRYDKFVHYQGYFKDDSLHITKSRQRGFIKARAKKFHASYHRQIVSDLQPIPLRIEN